MAYDIVKKLRQMMAKAQSTPSTHEAESIMVKVRQMLDAHGISLLTITGSVTSDDPVEVDRDVAHYWAATGWMRRITHAAGCYYGVTVVWHHEGNKVFVSIAGRESCRVAYRLMLPYLHKTVASTARRGAKEGRYRSESRAAYQIGAALAHRLYALAADRVEEQKHPVKRGGENLLVPVDEIKQAIDEVFGEVRPLRSTGRATRPTLQAIEDARAVNLADQLRTAEREGRLGLPEPDLKLRHAARKPPYEAKDNTH